MNETTEIELGTAAGYVTWQRLDSARYAIEPKEALRVADEIDAAMQVNTIKKVEINLTGTDKVIEIQVRTSDAALTEPVFANVPPKDGTITCAQLRKLSSSLRRLGGQLMLALEAP